ncbi:hypothetical protein [Thermomonas sp.]|uniref:hypothetical protein n=1 Tax=Thermomonas sp. TaxID=1971895 RepID=UPI0024896221|nr:hypothetical protein [Thermomonas sp.]MDI1254126.1 hypothetical protein [Thermomonas sp.]
MTSSIPSTKPAESATPNTRLSVAEWTKLHPQTYPEMPPEMDWREKARLDMEWVLSHPALDRRPIW